MGGREGLYEVGRKKGDGWVIRCRKESGETGVGSIRKAETQR